MKIADDVNSAGWKPILVFIPAFFLILSSPSMFSALGADTLVSLSDGLITYTLLNTWFGILVLTGVAVWYGSLSFADLGGESRKLSIGIAVTVGVWGIYSVGQLVGGIVTDDLSIYSAWISPGLLPTLGTTIGYFFGNAPFEELAFRGFLLVQLYLVLDGERWRRNRLLRSGVAIAGSSLIFTLFHIPAFLWGGIGLETLVNIFVYSVTLCLVYMRTRNIFIAIGFHGLANFSVPLFAIVETGTFSGYWELFWLVPAAMIVIAWPRLPVRSRNRNRVTPSTAR